MGDGGFFKGTSLEQDSRFANKQKKLLKSMSFPSDFNKKVDMTKVNMQVFRPWIAQKVVDLLGTEDEVVINYVYGLLEEQDPDPRLMQINLTGFLEKNAAAFVTELWKLLLSAQDGVGGIPTVFLQQKMDEIRKKKTFETESVERRKIGGNATTNPHVIEVEVGMTIVIVGHLDVVQVMKTDIDDDLFENLAEVEKDASRSRSRDRKRHEDRRHGRRSSHVRSDRSLERSRESFHKRRQSRDDVVKSDYIPSSGSSPLEQPMEIEENRQLTNKKPVETPEDVSPHGSPPRRRIEAPIFKSKWNDDEDDGEDEKKSQQEIEQRLRARVLQSMKK
ncbi:9426_t:CDS:2 [Paraglomus occultum]|uniref:9426_t:CDS:1 n=1 Tax=Paraglomus occultum TaxID=144539 RepID=A0A9N9A0C8_9GLOM|nr:9426_t:CDS:2 [Paraglomus occultum]